MRTKPTPKDRNVAMVAIPTDLHQRMKEFAEKHRYYVREMTETAIEEWLDKHGADAPKKEKEVEEELPFSAAELKRMVVLEQDQKKRQESWDQTYERQSGMTLATKKPLRKTAMVDKELVELRQRYGKVVLGVEMTEAEAVEVRDGMLEAILASGVTEG